MISKIRSLRAHQGFMRYFANTSWFFAEKILRMVVGLFVGIWVATMLGCFLVFKNDKQGSFS